MRLVLALLGGASLSVLGLGILWMGTPWHLQAWMGVPFFGLTFALNRGQPAQQNIPFLIMLAAAPVGGLITLFRDKSDSHLMPILIVCTWLAGVALGAYLSRRKGA